MVAKWVEWSQEEAAARWDAELLRYPSCNLYQSYGWGEFKRRSGWVIRRGSIVVDGIPTAMAQCLVREIKPAPLVFVWVPGGPSGSPEGRQQLGQALYQCYPRHLFYLRMSLLDEVGTLDKPALLSEGWTAPSISIGQPLTFHVDLEADECARRRNLSGNWRHNLRRGEAKVCTLKVWDIREPLDEVYAVYQEMCALQKIPQAFSLGDLDGLRHVFGQAFTLAVAVGEDGRPCAMRGFGRIGTRAHDLIAGVSLTGRRAYANFPLMWFLLGLARVQGALVYDLGGVDWVGAVGVSNFKKGLGGRLVSLGGEWEWTNSSCLRWGVNMVVRYRRLRQ